jgi:hypothetical protein
MKYQHNLYNQAIVDSLTTELQHAIESREVAIMTGDLNMIAVWDEQIQNIADYCKNNPNVVGF